MLISRDREKLVNSIVFFARNTQYCGKTKLFKLLYLLDFHHFREAGRSVTGLEYHAWKNGPVPFALVQEWDDLEADLATAIDIVPERVIDYDRQRVDAKGAFDDSHFTKRELRLMQELAHRHHDEMTKPLIGLTHEERGNNERIPYALAVPDDDPNREAVLEAAREFDAIAAADAMSRSLEVAQPSLS